MNSDMAMRKLGMKIASLAAQSDAQEKHAMDLAAKVETAKDDLGKKDVTILKLIERMDALEKEVAALKGKG